MTVRTLVFGGRMNDRYICERTLRGLADERLSVENLVGATQQAIAAALAAADGPVWLMRAGAWRTSARRLQLPRPSATGLPLCAWGRLRAPEQPAPETASEDAAWTLLHRATGGDLSACQAGTVRASATLPPLASIYLEDAPRREIARRLVQGQPLIAALAEEMTSAARRSVHFAPLDVYDDPRVRVCQVVTSLQRGGAERLTIDLSSELARQGAPCRIVALGAPSRGAFPTPHAAIELATGGDRAARAAAIARISREFGADLVHAHLIDALDVHHLRPFRLPLVMTMHNMQPGWPAGLAELTAPDSTLLVACAQAVETDLRRIGSRSITRTIWNGIDFDAVTANRATRKQATALRRAWGIERNAFVLVALANPRPQKRLHLLPAIVAATQELFRRHGIRRRVVLVLAGEAAAGSPTAAESLAHLHEEIARHDVAADVHFAGAIGHIAALLAACDALISTSAHEGLSLAQLEALAAGKPVVTTAVGGAAEVAAGNPAMHLLAADASPEFFAEDFATALVPLARGKAPSGRAAAARHFTLARMAERYRWLYPRAIVASARRAPGKGLLLVTNNFSTGGAQSSARRLLVALADRGLAVRATAIQEHPHELTPGAQALVAAGIPVAALGHLEANDPADVVRAILAHVDDEPPQAIVCWNAITEHKMLLADALLDVPLFDVSPGEMYFTSLENYFRRPRAGLPYRTPREYGARLAGAIVKYAGEASLARRALGTRVHVIPNGIALPHGISIPNGIVDEQSSETRAQAARRTDDSTLVIGTTARISPQKKLEELLLAVRKAHRGLPAYRLLIAGAPERGCQEYFQQLHRLAAGLPVEFVGQQDVQTFLPALDLFVMISEPAGCPNASLEAMAAGLPVIATDFGGAAEQVLDGHTGRIVPRGDATALAAAIAELARDPRTRDRFARAGRERIASHFSLEQMVDRYQEVLLGIGVEGVADRGRSQPAPSRPNRGRVRPREGIA